MNDTTLILYPRSYNKRGKEEYHSVKGVRHSGEEVNVKLRLSESAKANAVGESPSIAEFSREDLGATMPCRATDDNGPGDTSQGIILFREVVEEGEGVFLAGDARVIRKDSSDPTPFFGVGRIDIDDQNSPRLVKARAKLTELQESGYDDDSEEIQILKSVLTDPTNFSYRAIHYNVKDVGLAHGVAEFKANFCNALNQTTEVGVVPGVLVKLIGPNGKPLEEEPEEVFVKYQVELEEYQTGEEVFMSIEDKYNHLFASLAITSIITIPLLRFSCGAKGNKEYGERYERIRSTYYSDEGVRQVANVIITTQKNDEVGSTLLSRLYPRGEVLGSVSELNSQGGFESETISKPITVRGLKLESFGVIEGEVSELSDSISPPKNDSRGEHMKGMAAYLTQRRK